MTGKVEICFSCGRDIEPGQDRISYDGYATYHRGCAESNDPLRYHFTRGTLQPYVFRAGTKDVPMFIAWFGMPEYDTRKPVLRRYYIERARHVVIGLNEGTMTEAEAVEELKKVYW